MTTSMKKYFGATLPELCDEVLIKRIRTEAAGGEHAWALAQGCREQIEEIKALKQALRKSQIIIMNNRPNASVFHDFMQEIEELLRDK